MPGADLKAVVIGCGSWGTAFARLLARQGIDTEIVCRRAGQVDTINRAHRNPDYLADIELPASVRASTFESSREGGGLAGAGLVVLAVPSQACRGVLAQLAPVIDENAAVLSLAKGLESGTLMRISEVMAAELPRGGAGRIAVLSGPNHAEEVARDIPTAGSLAANDDALAARLQSLLSSDTFRIYINDDMVGVELAAATKNVIALAAGMSDGLGYGDNTKASLITRGLAEMARLGACMGASAGTYSGLAGMGDLIATCTSRHSRNRLAGELIARGTPADRVEAEIGMVAEGLTTAPAVRELAHRQGVEMPITEQVCAVLEGGDVRRAVARLMSRAPKSEAGAAPAE